MNWKRSFFTIWIGQAFSLLGSSLAGFALVWWLTESTGSATILAAATLMMILPQIVLGPLAGALVDRWNRRWVMIVTDSLIGLFSIWLAYQFFRGHARTWHIYVVTFVRAVGQVVHLLAMQSSTPLMVPDKHLARVAGMNQTLNGVMSIIAPPMGALLLGILPIQAILLIDVGTALLAVVPLCFVAIPSPARPETQAESGSEAIPAARPSVWQDIQGGLCYVWTWKGLLTIIVMAALLNFFGVPCLSFIPLLVTQHFQSGALELGWLQTASGVGLVCGGLLLSTWGGLRSRVTTAFVALAVQGIGAILMGAAPATAFALALAGNLLWGFTRPIIDGLVFAIVQSAVPSAMLGRVFSLMLSVAAATTPLGLMVAGPIADKVGVRFWFVLAGTAALCASAVGLLTPAVRKLESRKPGAMTGQPGMASPGTAG